MLRGLWNLIFGRKKDHRHLDIVNIEFTDRYQAMGIPYPDPKTVCKGQCEGLGYVPVWIEGDGQLTAHNPDYDYTELHRRWHEAEKAEPSDDGCHFVTCPDCEGTGKRKK